MRFYAGVGSREAPARVLRLATATARDLAAAGWILRSGHAPGMDQSFERGAGRRAEVYLPWSAFESHEPIVADVVLERPDLWTLGVAEQVHPRWASLSRGGRYLHARNVHQVLGRACGPMSRFVVCWTRDGAYDADTAGPRTGGTGLAIRLASRRGIPVFNLANAEHLERVMNFVAQGGERGTG